jgi:TIR domain
LWTRGAPGEYGVGTMMVSSPAGQDGIFISYRTDDAKVTAKDLYSRLARPFGSRQVFFAPRGISPPANWADVINERLRSCGVLLALIGDRWLTEKLYNPQDFVRIEIETALERPDVKVIPVLIDGVRMPAADKLPDSLAKLPYLMAHKLSLDHFDTDTGELIRLLNKNLPRRVLPVAPLAVAIPLFVLALRFAGGPSTRTDLWIAFISAILGAAIAAVDYRRSTVWLVAIETFLIWCISFSIYKLNIGDIHRLLPWGSGAWPASSGAQYLVILTGTAAIVKLSILLILARRSRKKYRVVHVLLPVFLACMTVGLGLKTFGYASGPGIHASGWIFFAALVASILAPIVVLKRKLPGWWNNPFALSAPDKDADTTVRPAGAGRKQSGL